MCLELRGSGLSNPWSSLLPPTPPLTPLSISGYFQSALGLALSTAMHITFLKPSIWKSSLVPVFLV